MKILFLIEALRKGGKERQLIELIESISKINKEIIMEVVLMDKDIEYKDFLNTNIKIHYLVRKYKLDVSIFNKLYKVCKDFKPNIIHSWASLFTLYAIPYAKLNNTKLIDGSIRYAVPVQLLSKVGLISKINFIFVDKIIANSYAGLEAHGLVENNKHLCIYNGFDFSRIKNLTEERLIKEKYKINTNYVIGMVARFSDSKDYNLFVKVALKILEKRDDVTFLCVGKGENEDKVKLMVPHIRRKQILFIGDVDNVEDIINIFDVSVLVTNTKGHAEGISNSIMEYMALSKTVIATYAGGNKELIADNRIWFGAAGNNIPRVKTFLSEVQQGIVPVTVWLHAEVGSNQDAKREVRIFNSDEIFDTPKPEKLIFRIFITMRRQNKKKS